MLFKDLLNLCLSLTIKIKFSYYSYMFSRIENERDHFYIKALVLKTKIFLNKIIIRWDAKEIRLFFLKLLLTFKNKITPLVVT